MLHLQDLSSLKTVNYLSQLTNKGSYNKGHKKCLAVFLVDPGTMGAGFKTSDPGALPS